ncbi:MAG: hypothetical protein J0I00_14440 [Burkholderiales bacterium]|uniref:YncE family protein n=1 Tax=Ottowia pentelensis TaxID=511108 RepID=A0ABV6PW23_9BURK|nr:hypothetical protein [Ottowia sp.]MBN9406604.1 hypothetical protein [Burkholderiales bacterium]MBS0404705.1 hypothetical protein [Pseudomonadota bacterium]MBS0413339.1 hypothetical protein [Pseudomonadota bacterium]
MRRLASSLRWLVRLAVVPTLCGMLLDGALARSDDASGIIRDAGMQLRWNYEKNSNGANDGLGQLTFDISDEASGNPLRYAPGQLAVWLQRQRPTLAEGELACRDRVKSLVSTGVGRRADVDLNTYRILSLNADRTLAFINPFVGLNNAKLESIVPLPDTPRAWVHAPSRGELWVLTGDAPARLVAVDTHRRQIVRALDLPGDGAGATLALDERGARVWVAQPAVGRVAVLDLAGRDAAWRSAAAARVRRMEAVETPDGPVILSTHADGRLQRWGANAAGVPQVLHGWSLPQPAQQLAFSTLARRLVAHDGQALLSIDPAGSAVRRLALGHPVADIAIVDEGRYAIAVGGDRMSMVDLATGTVHARSATVPGASRLALTQRFVYAVGNDEANADLWALADLRAGRVQPVRILLGSAGVPQGDDHRLRRAIAAADGAGLLVANAADRLIYQYAEGMMAPVGSYSNYKRTPLAIALLDLAPREVSPGRYQVPVRYDTGGMHHLIVSGAGPRFVGCDRVALPMTSGQAERESVPELKVRLVEDKPLTGARRRIVVALSEQTPQGSGQPLAQVSDLTLLMFDKRSGWQHRVHLGEIGAAGDATGRYAVEVSVPPGVAYDLFVGSVSRDLPFVRGRVQGAPETRP